MWYVAGFHITKGYAFPFLALTLFYSIFLKGGHTTCQLNLCWSLRSTARFLSTQGLPCELTSKCSSALFPISLHQWEGILCTPARKEPYFALTDSLDNVHSGRCWETKLCSTGHSTGNLSSHCFFSYRLRNYHFVLCCTS